MQLLRQHTQHCYNAKRLAATLHPIRAVGPEPGVWDHGPSLPDLDDVPLHN